MNSCKQRFIHERSDIIPIQQKSPTNKKENLSIGEYSLTQNFFDPSKSSPPNEFIIKLHMRMNKYYTDNDDNLDIK